MLKILLLTFLFLAVSLYASDTRLDNSPAAYGWEQKALDGDANAMYNLARFYQIELKDYDKAIYWYEKAYATNKDVDSANNLGYIYDTRQEYNLAIKWYKVASTQGDKDASFNIALLYNKTLNQPEKAIPYYEKSYKLGDKSAPLSLGIIYEDTVREYDKAIKWYKKAYNMGNMGGANNLGYLYENTKKDMKKAQEWYEKGAKEGFADSINNLGSLYHKQGNNIRAAAYILAMANYGYSKAEVLDFLKNDWKIDREILQKAYELQKTLDIPKHYTGGID
jgi:TPR repeat protein